MRLAVFLALSTTLILSSSQLAIAQAFRGLVLVKGDTSKNCSFISTTELQPVDLAQRLVTVTVGSSPYDVQQEMGFRPDQPYANGTMRWTAVRRGQYIQAVVNFRNDRALTRSLTMATNYKQSNEKQCAWEVRNLENNNNNTQPSLTSY